MSFAGYRAPVIFHAVDKITKPIRMMTRAVGTFTDKVNHAGNVASRGFMKMKNSIVSAAGSMGLFLGAAAAVQTLLTGIKIYARYEKAVSRLRAISGAAGEDMNAMKKSSQALGATTSFTATQVTNLQTELAKLGFKQKAEEGDKSITDMTRHVLALGSATGTELPQAAKQLGSAMKMFGLQSNQAGNVADAFSAATVNTALDMEFLETALVKIGPVAKNMGFDLKDSLGMLGMLANAGFDASTAGTSTKNIMLKMATESSKLSKRLGVNVRNVGDFTKALGQLSKSDISEMLEITDLRAVAAFQTYVNTAGNLEMMTGELSSAMDNGATAASIMRTQTDNLMGSWVKLTSAVQGWVIHLGESNSEGVRWLRNILDTVAAVFQLSAGMRSVAREAVVASGDMKALANFDRITKWAKALDFGLNVLIRIGVAMATWKVLTWGLAAAQTALSAAMTLATLGAKAFAIALNVGIWPITLIAAGIAALIFLTYKIIQNWDTWGKKVVAFMPMLAVIVFFS